MRKTLLSALKGISRGLMDLESAHKRMSVLTLPLNPDMSGQMDRCYQVHYLPHFAVDNEGTTEFQMKKNSYKHGTLKE